MKSFLHTLALTLLTPVVGAIVITSNSPALAQDAASERAAIERLQITHRDPSRIREIIRPALDPRGSIGQIDDKLIIATTAANLRQLKEMISETDVPARRLIIGVDFGYQPDRADNSAQQQSQAMEGDELVFVAGANRSDNSVVTDATGVTTESADTLAEALNNRRMTIAAEIIVDVAAVNLIVENVPGITGSHIVNLPLGVWQVINTPVFDADIEDQLIPQAVAVRVDRVP